MALLSRELARDTDKRACSLNARMLACAYAQCMPAYVYGPPFTRACSRHKLTPRLPSPTASPSPPIACHACKFLLCWLLNGIVHQGAVRHALLAILIRDEGLPGVEALDHACGGASASAPPRRQPRLCCAYFGSTGAENARFK